MYYDGFTKPAWKTWLAEVDIHKGRRPLHDVAALQKMTSLPTPPIAWPRELQSVNLRLQLYMVAIA
eukprot:c9607_g1_i1 orf=103-300(-)